MRIGDVWSKEYIDSEPIPVVSRDLLPWLKKDRREAMEGAMVKATDKEGTKIVHNGEGLKCAERDVRRSTSALATATDPKAIEFLKIQLGTAEGKAGFYRGKIYLLDKIIAAT